jgi:hypothetical protein
MQQSAALTTVPATNKVQTFQEVKHDFIHNFDVALYREKVKGMDTSEICDLIRQVFKPNEHYSFPKTSGRSFRYDWLNCIPGFVIHLPKMVLFVYHVYYLEIIFLVRQGKLKNYFRNL